MRNGNFALEKGAECFYYTVFLLLLTYQTVFAYFHDRVWKFRDEVYHDITFKYLPFT